MDVTREMIEAIPNKIRKSILHVSEYYDRVMYTYRYVHYDHFKEYPVLNECRGVIFNRETDELISRPFHKFYNIGEPLAAEFDLASDIYYAVKIDGFLIQAYLYQGQLYFSSRKQINPPMVGPILERHLSKEIKNRLITLLQLYHPATILLELVDPDHIILFHDQEPGLHLLALRKLQGDYLLPNKDLIVETIPCVNWQRLDKEFTIFREEAADADHEGYVLFQNNQFLKLKSRSAYYISSFLRDPASAFVQSVVEEKFDDLIAQLEARPDLVGKLVVAYENWNEIIEAAYDEGSNLSNLERKEAWQIIQSKAAESELPELYRQVALLAYQQHPAWLDQLQAWVPRKTKAIARWLEQYYLIEQDTEV